MKHFSFLFAALLMLGACIENDIPYPVIKASIASLEVEGARQVSINEEKRKVEIELEESVDIKAVNILSAGLKPENAAASFKLEGEFDLSQELKVVLKTYQDYSWTIVATQPIEHKLKVEGQIGDAVIDEVNCRAVVKVPADYDTRNLNIV